MKVTVSVEPTSIVILWCRFANPLRTSLFLAQAPPQLRNRLGEPVPEGSEARDCMTCGVGIWVDPDQLETEKRRKTIALCYPCARGAVVGHV